MTIAEMDKSARIQELVRSVKRQDSTRTDAAKRVSVERRAARAAIARLGFRS